MAMLVLRAASMDKGPVETEGAGQHSSELPAYSPPGQQTQGLTFALLRGCHVVGAAVRSLACHLLPGRGHLEHADQVTHLLWRAGSEECCEPRQSGPNAQQAGSGRRLTYLLRKIGFLAYERVPHAVSEGAAVQGLPVKAQQLRTCTHSHW